MALFPQTFLDDLRLQANIVQVIQEYVPLKRAGRRYKGLCPFHSEKTPSFHVDPGQGLLPLLRLQVGGDVFEFLELHEKVGFQDAVRMLAQKFGVGDPGAEPRATRRGGRGDARIAAEGARDRGGLFPRAAGGPGRRPARASNSRIAASPPQTIEQLGLGYAPQSRDGFKARLLKQGFAQGLLLQSGLVVQRDRRRARRSVP